MDPSFQFEDMISALLNSCGGSSEDDLVASSEDPHGTSSVEGRPQLDTKEKISTLYNNNNNNKDSNEPTFGDIVSNGALTPDLPTSDLVHQARPQDIRKLSTTNDNNNATPTCEEAVRIQSYLVRNNDDNDAADVQEVDASFPVDISQFQSKDDQPHSSANPRTKSKMIAHGEENHVKPTKMTAMMTTTTTTTTTLGDTSNTNIPAKILASKEPQSICDKWGLEDDSKCATPTSLDFNRASLSHSPLSSESPVSSQVSQFSVSSSLGYGSNSGSRDPIHFIDVLNNREDHPIGQFGPFISQDSGLGGGSSPHLENNHDVLSHQGNNMFWDVKSGTDETGLFPMNDLSPQRKGVSLMGLEAGGVSSSELGLQGLTGLFLNDEESISQTEMNGFPSSSGVAPGEPPQMSNAMKNILQLSFLEHQTPMPDLNVHQVLPESPTGMLEQDLYRPPLSTTPTLALTTHLSNALLGLDHHRQPPQIHPHLSARDLKQSANATTPFNDGCATFPNSTSTMMTGGSSRNGSSYPHSLPSPPLDIYGGGGIPPNETLMENLAALAQLSEMEDPNSACFSPSGDFLVPPPDMMGYNLPQYPKTMAFPGSNRLNSTPNRAYMEQQLMNQRSSLSPPLHTGRYPSIKSAKDWNLHHHHHHHQQHQHSHPHPHPNAIGMDGSRSGGRGCPPNRASKPMTVLVKFGQLGQGRGMFNSPHGFCLGLNQEIIIADTYNNRIQVCDKHGNSLYCFGVPGKDEGQLWCPRKIAVFPDTGNFVICDRGGQRSRMQIFTSHGQFVRQIPIRYIDIVAGLAINRHNQIVAVDSVTPTVFILSQYGELIKYIDCSADMEEPSDIAIHGREYYICDFKGHSVVVLHEDGTLLRRVGNKSVTQFPNGIDISDEGDILIGDSHGNQFHVAVYSNAGHLISEFQCPTVKVSRCCGLKITFDGAVVTLAKNNHHVLVLDTLCIY